jgi:hypothetical protein
MPGGQEPRQYEPGLRSGAWQKMRVNQGQEFAIRRIHTALRGRTASLGSLWF